jgi:hypothetical protein
MLLFNQFQSADSSPVDLSIDPIGRLVKGQFWAILLMVSAQAG